MMLVVVVGLSACGEEGERLVELTEQMAEEMEQLDEGSGGFDEPELDEEAEDPADEGGSFDLMPSGDLYRVTVTGSAEFEDYHQGRLVSAYAIDYTETFRIHADDSTHPESFSGSGTFEARCEGDTVARSDGPISGDGALLQTIPGGESVLFVYEPVISFLFPDPCGSPEPYPESIYSGDLAEADPAVPGRPTYYEDEDVAVYGLTLASIPAVELGAGGVERAASWSVSWDEAASSGRHGLVVTLRVEPDG